MGWEVSVNIAAPHFHRPNFVQRLKDILHTCPEVSPSRLELEILESAALEDMQYMRRMMQSCQALGVRFALDDFGTGFSSLSYLKRLPAETIKIDHSFVRGILEDGDDLTLVKAIVALAAAFHRHVVAEGVETASTAPSCRSWAASARNVMALPSPCLRPMCCPGPATTLHAMLRGRCKRRPVAMLRPEHPAASAAVLAGDDGATTPPDYNGCTAPMSGRSSHSRHSSTSCWLARVAASHAWARARLSVP